MIRLLGDMIASERIENTWPLPSLGRLVIFLLLAQILLLLTSSD